MRVGVDTGGTFTDVVTEDGRITKVPSTPADPSRAIGAGIADLGRLAHLAHGTTVPTNALLEGRVGVVALVTNEGLADVIEIARQDRPSLYDQTIDRPTPLVPRRLRYEVRGRLAADGREIVPLDLATLPAISADVDAVAVCLLHADLDPRHERLVAEHLRPLGLPVTCSHEISPEFREYERTVTTVVNAALVPKCRAYLRSIASLAAEVSVMTSAGGLLSADEAAARPAALLLSGPAGGVRAAAALARLCGFDAAVSFDMGGTSTDVCLVTAGDPEPAPSLSVAGYPVRLPSLDIHTIGAGGGSIAAIDPGGALAVGPRSAGAVPGPVCYGRGGTEPTVTDADLVLGRIPAAASFPGLGRLDLGAARAAFDRAGLDPTGVVDVVDAHMAQAVRHVTVERGVDPAALALIAFGGAGPLHACALAEQIGMAVVVVPPRAGVFSAVGLLTAPRQRDLVRSWPDPDSHAGLDDALAALGAQAAALVGSPDDVLMAIDCRYRGQSHELTVPSIDAFPAVHALRNGFERPGVPIEVVALRARARRPSGVTLDQLPAPVRAAVTGPAVLAESDCTVWVPAGWHGAVGPGGALVLRRS